MSGDQVKARGVIALDFDGVLNSDKAWSGPTGIDDPVPGAREFVFWLMDRGFSVYIFTTRAEWSEGRKAIREWLERHGFPPMNVTNEKHGALLFVDDRGYRFNGSFDDLKKFMQENPSLNPWNR